MRPRVRSHLLGRCALGRSHATYLCLFRAFRPGLSSGLSQHKTPLGQEMALWIPNTHGLRLALGPLNVTSFTLGKLRLILLQFNTLTFIFFFFLRKCLFPHEPDKDCFEPSTFPLIQVVSCCCLASALLARCSERSEDCIPCHLHGSSEISPALNSTPLSLLP